MNLDTIETLTHARLRVKISRRDKSVNSFASDVLKGLSSTPKKLPPKYFYDEMGSKLFEQICDLPEYYPTRTERAILERYAEDIAGLSATGRVLAELGSGNSVKTRLIIEAFLKKQQELQYIPIDFSKSILIESARSLLQQFPGLRITALVSDYNTALEALKIQKIKNKLILFLGSSIGNFEQREAVDFLRRTRSAMEKNERFLIGFDLKKQASILEPAYDDASGVTAKFNLNLLSRINRQLDGDFNLSRFRHRAFYNEDKGRIEIHIESKVAQTVHIGKLKRSFAFNEGETIHTENSYKYSLEDIAHLAATTGFIVEHAWFDDQRWFSLNLFKPI